MGRSPTGGFRGGLARGGQKRGLQADFQAAIAQEIEAFLGRQAVQGLDFEALETAVRQQVLQVAARALQGWLNADTSLDESQRSAERDSHLLGGHYTPQEC